MSYSFEIRKTSFVTQSDQEVDSLNLQILDSTALPTHPMNRYNCIDSNNLIYTSGNYIVYYNFFQNNKVFASRVSYNEVVGMTTNIHGNGDFAIATQSKDKKQTTVQIYTFAQSFVKTHILTHKIEFIDLAFCADNVIVLIGNDENNDHWAYVMGNKSFESQNLSYKVKKIVTSERKTHFIAQKGVIQFDFERMNLKLNEKMQSIQLLDYKIDDYIEIQYETILFLYENTLECHWEDTEDFCKINLQDFFSEPIHTEYLVKVGRNILITHKNLFMLTHLVLEEDKINFVNNYTYGDKMKAGILSIQDSLDEMHVALGVQIFERQERKVQNFIFNLSVFSNSKKYISPFIRLIPNGIQTGNFTSFETPLSSHAYTLIGQKITTLQHRNSLQSTVVYNIFETPKFMTVHPLGYQFVCGYDNIIKFYNKTGGDVEEIWSEHYICTAAKYSSSGSLVLACIEDSYVSLILYDTYNFKKIQGIPVTYLKINVNQIQWVDKNESLVLLSQNQVLKVNIITGEKISQYRQRRQQSNIICVDYDNEKDVVIACTNNRMILGSKIDEKDINFNSFKTIEMNIEINFVKFCEFLKIIFIGTKTGEVYWYDYPMKLTPGEIGRYDISQGIGKIKIHNDPIQYIGITNNYKYLVVSVKNSGYFSMRMRRKILFKNRNNNIMFQELGNMSLNKIEVSSQQIQQANRERLKILLQKRKTCFNDFGEFKKEWELKKLMDNKKIELTDKGYELTFINNTLKEIQEVKEKKKTVSEEIKELESNIEKLKITKEQSYEVQALKVYEQVKESELKLQETKKSYVNQYNGLVSECKENIHQINNNLYENVVKFKETYENMKNNLLLFQKRIKFEEEEEVEESNLQNQLLIKRLTERQKDLNNMSNELSISITHTKKENERYSNRKGFLEHKIRFFKDEIKNSKTQGTSLQSLKNTFEDQLNELEHHTHKKENKLKAFLKVNDALLKYKNIHETIVSDTNKQINLINEERKKTEQNIVNIQKQLNEVAQFNEKLNESQRQLNLSIKMKEQSKKEQSNFYAKISYWLKEVSHNLQNIRSDMTQNERQEKLKQLYDKYYIQNNIQFLLKEGKQNQGNECLWKSEKQRNNQHQIKEELKDQKQYILNNFQILNKCNKRIKEQINLNYLQIQTQNYNLIAQCNVRKQEAVQKRKMLHQLIDSVKQTQIYMDQMRKKRKSTDIIQSKNLNKIQKPIPYVLYEKAKESIFEEYREKKKQSQNNTHSQCSNFVVRKMLDINKLVLPQKKCNRENEYRRIQTAGQKKYFNQKSYKDLNDETKIIKPLTATLKSRSRYPLRSANTNKIKSQSKPTTCTTYTKKKTQFAS